MLIIVCFKSPIKKKSFVNWSLKAYKEKKSINDIDIDKESLMQLNRATNQFFAQKVKDTNCQSTTSLERKNESWDFNIPMDPNCFEFFFDMSKEY